MKGPLEKRGPGRVGRWDTMWFELQDSCLHVFESEGGERIERFELTGIADLSCNSARSEVEFLESFGGTKVRLRAKSPEVAGEWHDALAASLKSAKPDEDTWQERHVKIAADGQPPKTFGMSVTIVSCEGLEIVDAYCTCKIIGKSSVAVRTKVVEHSANPVWNHEGDFLSGYAAGDSLRFAVMDKDLRRKEEVCLGEATLESSKFHPLGFDGKLTLQNTTGSQGQAPVLRVKVKQAVRTFSNLSRAESEELFREPSSGPRSSSRSLARSESDILAVTRPSSGPRFSMSPVGMRGKSPSSKAEKWKTPQYALRVTIVGCKGLRQSDPGFGGKSDPYCVCKVSNKVRSANSEFRTPVVSQTLNPVWDHTATLSDFTAGDSLLFRILDSDYGKADDLLGNASLPISAVLQSGSFDGKLKLGLGGQVEVERGHVVAFQPILHVKIDILDPTGDRLRAASPSNSSERRPSRQRKEGDDMAAKRPPTSPQSERLYAEHSLREANREERRQRLEQEEDQRIREEKEELARDRKVRHGWGPEDLDGVSCSERLHTEAGLRQRRLDELEKNIREGELAPWEREKEARHKEREKRSAFQDADAAVADRLYEDAMHRKERDALRKKQEHEAALKEAKERKQVETPEVKEAFERMHRKGEQNAKERKRKAEMIEKCRAKLSDALVNRDLDTAQAILRKVPGLDGHFHRAVEGLRVEKERRAKHIAKRQEKAQPGEKHASPAKPCQVAEKQALLARSPAERQPALRDAEAAECSFKPAICEKSRKIVSALHGSAEKPQVHKGMLHTNAALTKPDRLKKRHTDFLDRMAKPAYTSLQMTLERDTRVGWHAISSPTNSKAVAQADQLMNTIFTALRQRKHGEVLDILMAEFNDSRRWGTDANECQGLFQEFAAPLRAIMSEYSDAQQSLEAQNGYRSLSQQPSLRLFGGQLMDEYEGWKQCKHHDPVNQLQDGFDDLMATAVSAQVVLKRIVHPAMTKPSDWPQGTRLRKPMGIPSAEYAYDAGPKSRNAAAIKALVQYGPSAGDKRHKHVLDLARIALVFSTPELLLEGLHRVLEIFEVVDIKNYFKTPDVLGYRYVEALVVVDVPRSGGGPGMLHVCELRFEEESFFSAQQRAQPHLRDFDRALRRLYGSHIDEFEREAAVHFVHSMLTSRPPSQTLRRFRAAFARKFGSTVAGWRYYLRKDGLICFPRFKEACLAMDCDHVTELWSELDTCHGSCVSLFELDPEGALLLCRLREYLLWDIERGAESQPEDSCLYRLPMVGDIVYSSRGAMVGADVKGNFQAWKLAPGEPAVVVEVDEEGDFLLRNESGLVSNWRYRQFFRFTNPQEKKYDSELIEACIKRTHSYVKTTEADRFTPHEFKALMQTISFSKDEAERLFKLVQRYDPFASPCCVTHQDILWVVQLPKVVDVNAARLAPQDRLPEPLAPECMAEEPSSWRPPEVHFDRDVSPPPPRTEYRDVSPPPPRTEVSPERSRLLPSSVPAMQSPSDHDLSDEGEVVVGQLSWTAVPSPSHGVPKARTMMHDATFSTPSPTAMDSPAFLAEPAMGQDMSNESEDGSDSEEGSDAEEVEAPQEAEAPQELKLEAQAPLLAQAPQEAANLQEREETVTNEELPQEQAHRRSAPREGQQTRFDPKVEEETFEGAEEMDMTWSASERRQWKGASKSERSALNILCEALDAELGEEAAVETAAVHNGADEAAAAQKALADEEVTVAARKENTAAHAAPTEETNRRDQVKMGETEAFTADLPYQHERLEERKALCSACDPDGNGYCSVASIDAVLRAKYGFGEAQKMKLIDAFNEAKNFGGKERGAAADYIEHKEFRVFLETLCKKLGMKIDHGKGAHFLSGSKVGSMKSFMTVGGTIVAIPHSKPGKSSSLPDLRAKFNGISEAQHKFAEMPYSYCSMERKPLCAYDPNAQRNRLAIDDAPVPYKNASTIEFNDGIHVIHKNRFKTIQKSDFNGEPVDMTGNPGIFAHSHAVKRRLREM